MRRGDLVKRIVFLVIILYVFLLSIKLMGGSFKLLGSGFAETLFDLTVNPFVGLFVGILATALVQSSSVTTSIIVGLTGSGVLNIGAAVPMIMGANIGTSVTNTIVSLGHITRKEEFRKAFEVATVHDFFNFIVVLVLFSLEIYFHVLEKSAVFLTGIFLGSNLNVQFESPLSYIINPVADFIKNLLQSNALWILILSLLLLFFSLKFFVSTIKPLAKTEFKSFVKDKVFKTPLRSFSFGLIFTIAVQSSSVSTSLAVPLAGVGLLTLEKLFPYILGANIGTTFTALLASVVTGSPAAVTVALEHFLFNTFGSIFIYPIRKIPIWMSRKMALLSLKSRTLSFLYIITVFYVVPLDIIFFFTWLG